MDINSNSKINTGVLLIGHGSRLPYGKDVITQIAEIYKGKNNYPVEIGFMEMSKPSIPSAINQLANKGIDKIIAIPVFLAHGVHTKQDIPHILGLTEGHENQDHHHDHDDKIKFEGEIILTEPLGADERIAAIVKDRVNNAL